MIRLNIHEAKTHLSRYLTKHVERGEAVLLCRRNVPVAEIRPVGRARTKRRPIGLGKGTFRVPPRFFDPLPAAVIDAFRGVGR